VMFSCIAIADSVDGNAGSEQKSYQSVVCFNLTQLCYNRIVQIHVMSDAILRFSSWSVCMIDRLCTLQRVGG
jgi:hypothetical protein